MTQAEFDKLTELLDREVLGNHMHGGEAAEVIAELEEVAQRDGLIAEIWHKGTEPPSNKHPYPVINPDTQEMAFAYYYLGWHYDRDYNPGHNMLWMDIEKILPRSHDYRRIKEGKVPLRCSHEHGGLSYQDV